MNWFLRLSGIFLLAVTLLPLIPTGKWYVRWWDFPRLQIACLLLIPVLIASVLSAQNGFKAELMCWMIVLLAALTWQSIHILPFSPLWKTEVEDSCQNGDQRSLKLMVSNLDYENATPNDVIQQLAEEQADILLLIEIDDAWRDRLDALRARYTYRHETIRGEGLGMAIWSMLPIIDSQTKHLVSDRRASLWVQLEMLGGDSIHFVGVHPTPPGLVDSTGDTRRDSRVRDAELIMIAREIALNRDDAWIVAGDFNDVAWSHTTRLFKRTSGLLDPRIGRTFMGTFMANYPPFRCPIDHVFLSEGFTLYSLNRKRICGSDHFAILASVSLEDPHAGLSPKPQGNDHQDAKEIINVGCSDAEQRQVASNADSSHS